MGSCMNHKCKNDPADSSQRVWIGFVGDSACDAECNKEYEKQKAHFFEDIVHSPEKTEAWLLGEID